MTTSVFTQNEVPGKRPAKAGALIWDLIRLQRENHPVDSAFTLIIGFVLPFTTHMGNGLFALFMIGTTVLLSARDVHLLTSPGALRFMGTWPITRRWWAVSLWAQAVFGNWSLLVISGVPAFLVVALMIGPSDLSLLLFPISFGMLWQQATFLSAVVSAQAKCRNREGNFVSFAALGAALFYFVPLLSLYLLPDFDLGGRLGISLALLAAFCTPVIALISLRFLSDRNTCTPSACDRKESLGLLVLPSMLASALSSVLPIRTIGVAGNHVMRGISAAGCTLVVLLVLKAFEYFDAAPRNHPELIVAFAVASGVLIAPMLQLGAPLLRALRTMPMSGVGVTLYLHSLALTAAVATWGTGLAILPFAPGVGILALTGWTLLSLGAASLCIPIMLRSSWFGGIPPMLVIMLLLSGKEKLHSYARISFHSIIGAVFVLLGAFATYAVVTRSSRVYRSPSIEEIRDAMTWGENEDK